MVEGGILGVGIDLVDSERMREALQRWGARFKDRVFLDRERKYCEVKADPSRHYAARFAVKEAVAKAFGTGLGAYMGWLDIEVVRDPARGEPSVLLSGRAAETARRRRASRILISMSHTRRFAVAQALVLGGMEPRSAS